MPPRSSSATTCSGPSPSDIPNVNPIDGYRIVDKLDPKLSYTNSTVALSNNAALVLNTDYTVVFDTATNTLTVDFTASGRAILAANPTAKVLVTVNTTVNTVGEITNTALVYPNAASFTITPGQPNGPSSLLRYYQMGRHRAA